MHTGLQINWDNQFHPLLSLLHFEMRIVAPALHSSGGNYTTQCLTHSGYQKQVIYDYYCCNYLFI